MNPESARYAFPGIAVVPREGVEALPLTLLKRRGDDREAVAAFTALARAAAARVAARLVDDRPGSSTSPA